MLPICRYLVPTAGIGQPTIHLIESVRVDDRRIGGLVPDHLPLVDDATRVARVGQDGSDAGRAPGPAVPGGNAVGGELGAQTPQLSPSASLLNIRATTAASSGPSRWPSVL